jgi:hypothetical protein
MNELIDNVARILATPMPRRKAMKLFGGALAAAVVAFAGAEPLKAAACTSKDPKGSTTCGSGSSAKCCPAGTCCAASHGSSTSVTSCCTKGQYVCPDGTCTSSVAAGNKTCKKC